MRQICRNHPALIACQNSFVVPSFDQTTSSWIKKDLWGFSLHLEISYFLSGWRIWQFWTADFRFSTRNRVDHRLERCGGRESGEYLSLYIYIYAHLHRDLSFPSFQLRKVAKNQGLSTNLMVPKVYRKSHEATISFDYCCRIDHEYHRTIPEAFRDVSQMILDLVPRGEFCMLNLNLWFKNFKSFI